MVSEAVAAVAAAAAVGDGETLMLYTYDFAGGSLSKLRNNRSSHANVAQLAVVVGNKKPMELIYIYLSRSFCNFLELE